MDFGSLLQNEISKKKQILNDLSKEKEVNTSSNIDSRYFKASEILEKEQDYEERKQLANDIKQTISAVKRKYDDNDIGKEVENKKAKLVEEEEIEINSELQKAQEELRKLEKPVRLFGESDKDVVSRYNAIISKSEQNNEDVDQVKKPETPEISRSQSEIEKDESNKQVQGIKSELMKNEESEQKPQLLIKDEDFIIDKQDVVDNSDKVSLQIRDYIKFILTNWDEKINKTLDISARDKELEINKETKKWVLPLLVKLKKQNLENDLLVTLSTVMIYLQEGNFLKANEAYLKLSIGNVSWPIGVVNVGIHSRSNHSKIAGKENISNIMKDEVTRKWILGVKRLISLQESTTDSRLIA